MSCVKQTSKKYTERPSPPFPANECRDMTKRGNDGSMYESVAASNGVYRWVKKVRASRKSPAKKSIDFTKQIFFPKASRKSPAKKSAVRKSPSKKSASRKSPSKKSAARKSPAKKSATKKSCSIGQVQRKAYTRKAYTRADGTRVKAVRIPANCIVERGSGTGKKLGIVMKKGELKSLGYEIHESAAERRDALNKAVKKYGALSVFRKVNLLATLQKNTSPANARKFKADASWIEKNHM